MKKKYLLALNLCLLAPLTIHAAEKPVAKSAEKSTEGSDFGKLTFFPEQNTFVNNFSLSYTEDDYTLKNSILSIDVKNKTTAATESIEYSFLPNQEIDLEFSYAQEKLTTSVGTANDTKSSGFGNPVLAYRFRFMKQKEQPLNIDFYGKFSADLIEKRTATTTDDGTVSSGKNVFTAGALFSGEQGAFVWSLTPEVVYNGEEKAKNANTSVTSTTDPYMTFAIGGDGQFFFTPMFAADFGLGFEFIPETTTKPDNQNSITTESRALAQLRLGVNAIVIPNKLDIYLHLSGTSASDADVKQSGVTTYKIADEKVSAATLGAKVYF